MNSQFFPETGKDIQWSLYKLQEIITPCWTCGCGHVLTTEQANRRCLKRVRLGWIFTHRMDCLMDLDEAPSEPEPGPGFMILATGSARVPVHITPCPSSRL